MSDSSQPVEVSSNERACPACIGTNGNHESGCYLAAQSSTDAAISSNDRLPADQQELVDVRGELLNALHAAGVPSSEVRDAIDSLVMTRLKHAGLGPLDERPKASEDCPDCTKLVEERDRAEAYADQLADMISIFLEVDIGEHSSANCPWEEAIEAMRVAIGNKPPQVETSDSRILPCDVTVGHTTIKAGCPVSAVLKSIKVHAEARTAFSSPASKASAGGDGEQP